MDLDAQRGARILDERKRLGWSQQAAADAAGIRREMWARYEAGSEPGAKALAGMGGAGVDVLFVLTGQHGSPAALPSLSVEEEALLESYRRCSRSARIKLIQSAALLAAGINAAKFAPTQQPPSVNVSSKRGHAAGRDLIIKQEEK